MAGEIVTNTTTLDDLLPSIVAEAMFQAQERSIMRNFVRNYDLPFGSGKTITVPKYGAFTVNSLTEANDMSLAAVSSDKATLTVAEVGGGTIVSDLSVRTSATDVIADVGSIIGSKIAEKMDVDLVALFDGFSTAIGDGTGAITAAKVFEAVAKLRALKLDPAQMVCVLHPYIAYDLKSSITSTFAAPASEVGNTAMRSGFVGMLAGIPVYESANIVDTAGDSKGAVFHRDALGLAVLQDINIELQRDASARGTEVIATATYGVGELNDTYGVEMSFDSSIVDA